MESNKRKVLLIDGNSLTYRAYYGSVYAYKNGPLKNTKGQHVNAVLTFFRMVVNLIDKYEPTHILVAFDKGPKTIRHEKLKSYKAGRKKTPMELIEQFPIVKEMLSKMQIPFYELDNIEADDIIGTLAKKFENSANIFVVSSDKDLYQLVNENISIISPQNGNNPDDIILDKDFYDRFQYYPNQTIDFKALVGDSSDNLPGVKGLGPKTAIKLLNDYNTLEKIYENIDEIKSSIKEKLLIDKEMAFLCKEIATLILDVENIFTLDNIINKYNINDELISFFEKYDLYSLIKKYKKTNDNPPEKEEVNREMLYKDKFIL